MMWIMLNNSGIDCLVSVTAHFFKAGDKTIANLEDEYTFTSYGEWHDDKSVEYWDLVPPKPVEDPINEYLGRREIENEEHYVILKDFIGFSFRPIFFGDFGEGRGSGIYFDDLSLEERLEGYEDTLVSYAQEEKAKGDAERKRHNDLICRTRIADETDTVWFILALDYVVEECGTWDCLEYDSSVEIVGKLDTSRLREIIT